MDFLAYFAIVEQDRNILNPIGVDKLVRAAHYAGLRDGQSVLDIGSGKGAVLRQWAGRWAIQGTGVELNPAFVQQAQAQAEAAGVADRLTFWQGKALDFSPDLAGYDVVVCLGALFALGSFAQAAAWMVKHTRPGGAVILGDVYLKKPGPAAAEKEWWADLPDLYHRSQELEAAGVEIVGLTVSDDDNWDFYSSVMWSAVHRWARENPNHPDRAEIVQKTRKSRTNYLRWEREYVGWAVWVGRIVPKDC